MADDRERAPSPPFIDSHAHLSMPLFAEDLPRVLARAAAAGMTDVLTAATSLADAGRNADLARPEGAPRVWAAVGFHPHEAKSWRDGDDEVLAEFFLRPGIVAIGETGLDYHYDLSPRPAQREVLARQVRLATRLKRPIIVHCRDAADDVIAILEGEGARECGGVLHCFTESSAFAERCLSLGFYISFSGILTFKNAGHLREVAKGIPADRLLAETDSPFLAPVPHRGERNEPERASVVTGALAELRGISNAELSAAISANFRRFLGLPPA
ncbi:MAG: TatD family hydrolase [Acidobacteria bacterium]|nr:TatD family hydrolase [Acidobacteriota bacterium]